MVKPGEGNPALPLDILIFDMDGVLIDVSRSYRKTIQKTIQLYLATCLGLKSGRKSYPLMRPSPSLNLQEGLIMTGT